MKIQSKDRKKTKSETLRGDKNEKKRKTERRQIYNHYVYHINKGYFTIIDLFLHSLSKSALRDTLV